MDKPFGFVSLSDIYSLSSHSDSLAVPILNIADIVNRDSLQHILLEGKYREAFFSGTKISPKDSLFIYDYSNNVHLAFALNQLEVVAILDTNPMLDVDQSLFSQYDYSIGFQIDSESLQQIGQDYRTSFVSLDSQSPFEKGKMQAIEWKKMEQNDFPSPKSRLKELHDLDVLNSGLICEAYSFATKDYEIYLMDYFMPEDIFHIEYRLMLIIDAKTGKLIREELLSDTWSKYFATINVPRDQDYELDPIVQYTGKLLKNRPEVLFGLSWPSFGCDKINYIPLINTYIAIKCDYRQPALY